MKIIAFDTQCSRDNGFYCEMCKFGYAVANDIFHVFASDEMYIKASKPTGNLKKIVRVDEEKLKNAPSYKLIHRRIDDILTEDDAIFLAHSPVTDFRHLWCMDKGYQTENIPCKAYDIHTIVRNYAYLPSYSLSGICSAWGIKHRSKNIMSNAEACIKIMEFICNESKLSIEEVLHQYGGNALIDSGLVYHKTMQEYKRERLKKYLVPVNKKAGKFSGTVFSLSESFETSSIEIGLRVAEYIYHNGGTITTKASESNIFIWDGNLASKRLESVNINGNIKVVSPNELMTVFE